LNIVRPGRVAYWGTAVHPGSAVVADCSDMRNDPEVEAIAMQRVLGTNDRGWEPQDISKDRDGSGLIFAMGPDPGTGKSLVRRMKSRAGTVTPESFANSE